MSVVEKPSLQQAGAMLPRWLTHFHPLAALLALFKVLIPSFMVESLFPGSNVKSFIPKARPTSYLDGLRGLASWFVFNTHLSPLISRRMGAGWGHDQESRTFLQLPWVHFIHAGGFPIHIFFVINGFILSLSTVKAMEQPSLDPAAMMKRLSLAIYRRPLRLFLPSFASTLFILVLVRFDAFNAVDRLKHEDLYGGWPILKNWPQPLPTFWAQLKDVIFQDLRMLRILERNDGLDYSNIYNTVLWTTSVQYQGTLLIILGHAACYYMTRSIRITTLIAICVISVAAGQFILLSFLLGWMLAELNVYMTPPAQDIQLQLESGNEKASSTRRCAPQALWWTLLAAGLYSASYPRFEPERTFGFKTMYSLTPPSLGVTSDLWHSIGAFTSIFAIGQIPLARDALSGTYLRYIGKLAFAIYLTHLAATHLAGVLIFDWVWSVTRRDTPFGETIGFVIAYLLTWFVNVWVSDVWFRTVEDWCTQLAEKMQALMLLRLVR